MRIARRGFEKFVEVVRQRREALLVIGLAAEARNGDVVRRGLRRARQSRARAQTREQRSTSPDLFQLAFFVHNIAIPMRRQVARLQPVDF